MTAYYFGCDRHLGHYLHRENLRSCNIQDEKLPWSVSEIDGGLCKSKAQTQGEALLHHKEGWTALAFWDRTIDTRPGSNSVFFLEGTHTFDEMKEKFSEIFPSITKRLSFPIILNMDNTK